MEDASRGAIVEIIMAPRCKNSCPRPARFRAASDSRAERHRAAPYRALKRGQEAAAKRRVSRSM